MLWWLLISQSVFGTMGCLLCVLVSHHSRGLWVLAFIMTDLHFPCRCAQHPKCYISPCISYHPVIFMHFSKQILWCSSFKSEHWLYLHVYMKETCWLEVTRHFNVTTSHPFSVLFPPVDGKKVKECICQVVIYNVFIPALPGGPFTAVQEGYLP